MNFKKNFFLIKTLLNGNLKKKNPASDDQFLTILYMNTVLLFALSCAVVIGFFNGLSKIDEVRKNPSLGVKPSKNLFCFFFNDRYR